MEELEQEEALSQRPDRDREVQGAGDDAVNHLRGELALEEAPTDAAGHGIKRQAAPRVEFVRCDRRQRGRLVQAAIRRQPLSESLAKTHQRRPMLRARQLHVRAARARLRD